MTAPAHRPGDDVDRDLGPAHPAPDAECHSAAPTPATSGDPEPRVTGAVGYNPTRRTEVEGRRGKREALQEAQHALRVLQWVSQAAYAAHLLTPEDIRALRAQRKRLRGRVRTDVTSMIALRKSYLTEAARIAGLLGSPDLALAHAERFADEQLGRGDALKSGRAARRKQRARRRAARLEARARKTVTLAELSDEQAAVVAARMEVVRLVNEGKSWSEACQEARVDASRATVMRWRQRFRIGGQTALIDRRVLSGRPGFPPEIRTLARAAYRRCRGGGRTAVYLELKARCAEAGLIAPSPGWVADYIRNEIPDDEKLVRDEGVEAWDRTLAPRAVARRGEFANDEWQCDDTPLDIWVRSPRRDGTWEATQPYLTAIVDVFSRAAMAASVFTRVPNAWSVQLTLRKAILPKNHPDRPFRGTPRSLVMDNGKNYRSDALGLTLNLLNIRAEYCAPRSPNEKPQVERFLRSLQEQLLPRFDGYKGAHMRSREAAQKHVMALLTIEQLREEIALWADHYNATLHTGIAGPFDYTPRALWEESKRLVEPDPRVLDRLLLREEDRVVRQNGVQLTVMGGDSRWFWSPTLVDHAGTTVTLAYNPEDLSSVLVCDVATKEPICEAYDMDAEAPRYTADDVVAARHRKRDELRGVVERLASYHEEAERTDRESPKRLAEAREWAAARKRQVEAAAESRRDLSRPADVSVEQGRPRAVEVGALSKGSHIAEEGKRREDEPRVRAKGPRAGTTSSASGTPTTSAKNGTGPDPARPGVPEPSPKVLSMQERLERRLRGER